MKPDTGPEAKAKVSESITDRPDGWLLREWKSGDERAAAVLIDRYAIRLVAFVASRLNRRFQASIDPSEVVQSAMGSFFDAAKHSRIQVSTSVSLWRLLATFARRKMARSIERQSAIKRGGDRVRRTLDGVEPQVTSDDDAEDEADSFVTTLKTELPNDLFVIVEGLLAGQPQRELAKSLGIDERTVRRRLSRIREHFSAVVRDEGSAVLEGSLTRSPTASQSLPRVKYGEFVLGKLIGSGGFGKVYRAKMQVDGGTVAIKFLRKAFWQNEFARASFMREISIATQIAHPGVIRYLGYGESPHGGPYVLSEWIDGQSLHHFTSPSLDRFTDWLVQICHALTAVHEIGLVHGDLAPSNILVDHQNRIKIADFGFSQGTLAGPNRNLGGTPGFAAPEQIDPSFGSVSPKTDIYAIGGLIHWYLFKQPPRSGSSPAEMLFRTLQPEARVFDQQSEIPQKLNHILMRTLMPAPSERTITLPQIISCLNE